MHASAIKRARNLPPDDRQGGVIAVGLALAMAAAIIALNAGRLTAIALFPEHYDFLHTGLGAQLIGFAGLGITGTIILFGVQRSREYRHG